MKITVVKITTPCTQSKDGHKMFDLNLRQHKAHKEVFIDPWVNVNSHDYKKKLQEIFFECGELMDQTTTVCDVKADLTYTINGVEHFHQTGIPYAEEIENMHLADVCAYNKLINSYAAGHRVEINYCSGRKEHVKQSMRKRFHDRYGHKYSSYIR